MPSPQAILRIAAGDPCWTAVRNWLPAEPAGWRVATVNRPAEVRLAAWVAEHRSGDRYHRLTNEELPIRIGVDKPDRVGTDRLLAAVAVNRLRAADRPAIIIDAGSAITVDLVTADGVFQGGVILPGFGMVARALATQTDQLPFVDFLPDGEPPPVVGKATEAAIRSGLYWGTVGAVREIVRRMASDLAVEPEVFVAGGDTAQLAGHIAESARVVPDLVLAGIALKAAGQSFGA
jgi:type III pantothenate kinase